MKTKKKKKKKGLHQKYSNVDHSQIIGGDTAKLLGRIYPPIPPGFRHPCPPPWLRLWIWQHQNNSMCRKSVLDVAFFTKNLTYHTRKQQSKVHSWTTNDFFSLSAHCRWPMKICACLGSSIVTHRAELNLNPLTSYWLIWLLQSQWIWI